MLGIKNMLLRNIKTFSGNKAQCHCVNLEWWSFTPNVGDCLAPVIYDYMLKYYNLTNGFKVKTRYHLMTIGSIIGIGNFDSVIWGSGIHRESSVQNIIKRRKYVKYDIRAVRGPITAFLLKSAGYQCPDVYGDPAILMPLIYQPNLKVKKYPISIIKHYTQSNYDERDDSYHYINVKTTDWMTFIDEIVSSELIVSSSLHGIILAETYGVPAIFLTEGVECEMMKFFDWYYSTGRISIKLASNVSEAVKMQPMNLPKLSNMQEQLLKTFPRDLWVAI